MSAEALELIAALLARRTGLTFSGTRREMLRSRMAECAQAHGLDGLDRLAAVLAQEGLGSAIWNDVIARTVTDESSFFRYHQHFDALRDFVLPAVASNRSFEQERTVRVLSAGCSRGQEPYSVAMLWRECGDLPEGVSLRLCAVDLCGDRIAQVQRGAYAEPEMRGLSAARRERFFRREGERWLIDPGLRAMVQAEVHNILLPMPWEDFDVILCRNVTIYFSRETTRRVMLHLLAALRPGGYLFVGHSETYHGLLDELQGVQLARTMVYRRALPRPRYRHLSEAGPP